jgi:hypothetical protein
MDHGLGHVLGNEPSVGGISEFIDSLKLPVQETLLSTPIRRVSRRRAVSVVPRRSGKLAAKTNMREPMPEAQ